MNLSRTSTHALYVLVELAKDDSQEPVPAHRLAESAHLPKRSVAQILRRLVKHGILNSTKGTEGGYLLARPLESIHLLDVVQAVDGPIGIDLAGSNDHPVTIQDRLERLLKQVNEEICSRLREVRLSLFLDDSRRRAPGGVDQGQESRAANPS